MFRVIASLLLLGLFPPTIDRVRSPALPTIAVMHVASPATIVLPLAIPRLSASGAMLIDLDSGEELFEINADTPRPMASLTKIMTALLVLEHHSLNEILTVPPIAEDVRGSAIHVKTGEQLRLSSMMKALLLPSANDAAYALATYHGGSVAKFVKQMNERARSLGLHQTHFANPAGLDDTEQYSSPRDLTWLTVAALRKHAFRAIVDVKQTRISSLSGTTFDLTNTNELLHDNENVFGVKTGTTDSAGECLIVAFVDKDRSYLLVLLKSSDRYTDALNVLAAVHAAP